MILMVVLVVLLALWLPIHIATRIQCRKLYQYGGERISGNERDSASTVGRRAHVLSTIKHPIMVGIFSLMIVTMFINTGAVDSQVRDQQQVRYFEKAIKIRTDQAEALCTEFSALLGKTYPMHEKRIFGQITPENIDLYWVSYPQIKASTTAVELTERIKTLRGAYYDLRNEREVTLKNLRYRAESPWFVGGLIGEPLREKTGFGMLVLLLALGIGMLAVFMHAKKETKKFWTKAHCLGIADEVSNNSYPPSVTRCGELWSMLMYLCIPATAISLMIVIIGSLTYLSEQISDKQRVVQIERQMVITGEKASVLSEEFKRILVTEYQVHESEIFSMIAPRDMRVYLANYPELRLSETVIALVGQMNVLWGEYYERQIEREKVIVELRYRSRSPWVIQSIIPSAERMLEEAKLDVHSPVTIQGEAE